MAKYRYTAKNKEKRTVAGIVDAETASEAAGKIRQLGYWPMDIVPVSESSRPVKTTAKHTLTAHGPAMFPQISIVQRAFFWHQLAALLHSGMTVTQSAGILQKQIRNGTIEKALREIEKETASGMPLSQVMVKYPRLFSQNEALLIHAGEVGGQLERMADTIAQDLDREMAIRRMITNATIYPAILVLALIFIPPLHILILESAAAYFAYTLGILCRILLGILIVYFVGRSLLQIPGLTAFYDEIKIAFPLVGKVVKTLASARFCRILSNMSSSGVSIVQSMVSAASACGNSALGRRVMKEIGIVENGGRVAEALTRANIFNPVVLSMAGTGETSGDLCGMLNKVAEYQEEEGKSAIHRLMLFLEVGLILIVALTIGHQVISFYRGYANQFNGF